MQKENLMIDIVTLNNLPHHTFIQYGKYNVEGGITLLIELHDWEERINEEFHLYN